MNYIKKAGCLSLVQAPCFPLTLLYDVQHQQFLFYSYLNKPYIILNL
nr:MAG TPA: hypothetical protein [Caudoviricetes sp.]